MRKLLIAFVVLIASLAPSVSPATEVAAEIDEDATWVAANSPYTVSEDVTVAAGATLTIESGVSVEFAAGTSLFIQGELLVRGTESNPIVFTGQHGEDGRARWGSVVFEDSSVDAKYENLDEYRSGSILEWAVLEYGLRALKISGAAPYITNSTFRYNLTAVSVDPEGGAAIYIEEGSTPRIVGCTFTENEAKLVTSGGAIYATSSDPIIQDNVFTKNIGSYGGALSTDLMASPIVGNIFEENESQSEGGGVSLISTVSAFLNNRLERNRSVTDGGGLHVCVTCFPHSNPFIIDNTVAHNTMDIADPHHGSAGVGAAYVRRMTNNNIHDNYRADELADFGWYQELEEGYPGWVANPTIDRNWWGTTDTGKIADTIFDGTDAEEMGKVSFEPVLSSLVTHPLPRVTITTRKIRYVDADDPMPVFLTIYNPGDARDLELVLMLQYGELSAIPFDTELDFPGASKDQGVYRLQMPENGVYFTRLLEPDYSGDATLEHGYWHAAIFDADSGERIGEVCSSRFELSTTSASEVVP